jgi:hypothetical protein
MIFSSLKLLLFVAVSSLREGQPQFEDSLGEQVIVNAHISLLNLCQMCQALRGAQSRFVFIEHHKPQHGELIACIRNSKLDLRWLLAWRGAL